MLSVDNALDILKVVTGAGAAVILGWIKSKVDSRKNKADSQGMFTTQLINRLRDVEIQLDNERIHNEKLLQDQAERYQNIIDALSKRVDALEQELKK